MLHIENFRGTFYTFEDNSKLSCNDCVFLTDTFIHWNTVISACIQCNTIQKNQLLPGGAWRRSTLFERIKRSFS